MIVVADTTILSNLIKINQLDWLHDLFGEVLMPKKVFEEVSQLVHFGIDITPFLSAPWLKIIPINNYFLYEQLLQDLDEGEAEAIVLAQEKQANFVLIDELQGRRKATELGLHVLGTVGVLMKAKELGIITEIKHWLDTLKTSGFWLNPRFEAQILRDCGEI